jgi:hypothetical protein
MDCGYHPFCRLVSDIKKRLPAHPNLKHMADIILLSSILHFSSYFNILVRAHRTSQQLRHLSTLGLSDTENGTDARSERVSSVGVVEGMPKVHAPSTASDKRRTIRETMTLIRSPCAELEGSNRWTIVPEKRPEYR